MRVPPVGMSESSPVLSPNASVRHAFLLGRGRSGTTWISQILNRFAACVYKHEPFNPGKSAVYSTWLDQLGTASAAASRETYDALVRGCVHDVDYPPFLPGKTCRRQPIALLRATWQLGKVLPPLKGVYQWYGKPQLGAGDWALTKQVNFPNEKLPALTEALRPKLIAVLRGPFASVSSSLRFYAKTPAAELRPDHALARVSELTAQLADELPGLRPYTTAELADLSNAAFEALRWRIQTEPLARLATRYDDGMIVTHEAFAADPLRHTEQALAFLGWPLEEAVLDFVRSTTSGTKHRAFASEKKKQHGVHRGPEEAVQRWQRDLDEQQITDVASIIAPSELLEHWPDQAAPRRA